MTNEPESNKGPACACGKVDLYEEWLKQNEKKKDEIPVTSGEAVNSAGSSHGGAQPDQHPEQTRK